MKLLIVDDDVLVREGLKIIIESEDDFQVLGEASNGREAIKEVEMNEPDIVLMDIRMPDMDGIEATRQIKKQTPHIKVLLLTTFKDDEYIAEAIRIGADGYMLKNQPSEQIMDAIRAVYAGTFVYGQGVGQMLKELIQQQRKLKTELVEGINERESEVLSFIAEGLNNKEIADKLYLSEGTIRNYVTSLLGKLNLRDRTQLAIYYLTHIRV